MSTSTISSRNAAVALSDFTSPALIAPHLQAQEMPAAIRELSQTMQQDRGMPDLAPFYQTALERELLASTELEAGVAFPHARLPGLNELFFAMGRCDQPLRWGAKAVPRVRLIFLIAVPESDSGAYLRLVSGFARLTKDRKLMQKLQAAEEVPQILKALQEIKLGRRSDDRIAY